MIIKCCAPTLTLFFLVVVQGTIAMSGASSSSTGHLDRRDDAVILQPAATYNGGYTDSDAAGIRLRIANGGAGQSGLIGAWADAFIQHCVQKKSISPFQVGWYLGDTTQSLSYLAAGQVDVAVTYNGAAEKQSIDSKAASQIVYGFRDHFLLVGPKSNPANLSETDDILLQFNKIVTVGNADAATPPTTRDTVRFLSRFDKSATNIKESQIFITIGQVPWAYAYSTWYHQYPRFPLQAIQAASLLSEYTLTDRGTWLSSPSSITDALNIYKAGSDDASDLLLNPAHVLLGTQATSENQEIWTEFMSWVVSADGGQKVIREFVKNGQVLYSPAPVTDPSSSGSGSSSQKPVRVVAQGNSFYVHDNTNLFS